LSFSNEINCRLESTAALWGKLILYWQWMNGWYYPF
jgi:hypothetical protein